MLAGQPIVILRDNVERVGGSEAQKSNIMAAKAIAEAVRTTLGPRGMDKMLVAPGGDVVITNDGVTILHEMKVEHPTGKLIIEVAETQDEEVGDGTTTATIFMGALMAEAEAMLEKKIHSTIIANGYTLGMNKALEILEQQSITATDDREMLRKVALTSVTGKTIEDVKDKIVDIVVDAVTAVARKNEDGKYEIDEDDVVIKTMIGDQMSDAEFLDGFLIDKTRVQYGMPKVVEGARIACLSQALEAAKTQTKAKIKITSSEQMEAFNEKEQETLREFADTLKAKGVNAVFCQKGIADAVQYHLLKHGIFAIQDVPEKDLKRMARAVGATIVNKPEDITEETIGEAEKIAEMKDIVITQITGCKNKNTVSILLKGTSQVFVDELERGVYDGIRVVMDALEDGKFVVGGAAIDTELMLQLQAFAATQEGRTQLAIEAFARIFEAIPNTLAENSGYDPIDKVVALKAAHAAGNNHAGLDVYTGEIIDMYEAGVIEPMRVKKQAIMSSAETASLIIRVDDMMLSKNAQQMSRGM
ncbi:thermosome subunit [Methanomicrobiaceae archaeon CYW5]|uniref:thermosome subunit alpha n=1 Tax=Methanovulcanius yangii TaxID=1789227 RepID=UPI0029CA1868|nr:thermosome subunit alpha [Methanovulcanius yangii]MBT8508297.1 thermosome subunit [Methanovulcanius yangii]